MSTAILRNTGAKLERTFYADGTATDADGTVTVAVLRADGTTLTSGNATTEAGAGLYSFTIAPQANLDRLAVSWTGAWSGVTQTQTDTVEIVGGFYATIAELQALSGLSAMSDDQVVQARQEFEDLAERYTGQAWVPRYHRETLQGFGSTRLLLSKYPVRAILSASSTDTQGTVTNFTTTNWARTDYGQIVTDGDVLTASVYGERNLTVAYEHGADEPPAVLRRACRDWVKATLLRDQSGIARTVLSYTDADGNTQRFGTIDWERGRPTGLDSVDSILNGLGRAAPVVA